MEIEKEIEIIKKRNARVESDKVWEISWTRRLFIAAITCVVAIVWLMLIHETIPYLKAVVPVAGYILSTLSLPVIKKWWVDKFRKN